MTAPDGLRDACRLDGQVALVTGGGRGLGAAYARLLAARGASVVVNDTGAGVRGDGADGTVAQAVVDEILAASGRAVADANDVGRFEGGAAAVRSATDAFGRLDVLINNAGTLGDTPLDELTEERLLEEMGVHVAGTLGTVRAALPGMLARGHGRVVNTTSEAALSGLHDPAYSYSAAKAAVWGITMTAAAECAGTGVTVNAVSPGALTRMSRAHLERAGIPDGLDLSPERVADVVVELCLARSAGVNGRVVHTAGGHVREYVLTRASTELAAQLAERVAEPRAGAAGA